MPIPYNDSNIPQKIQYSEYRKIESIKRTIAGQLAKRVEVNAKLVESFEALELAKVDYSKAVRDAIENEFHRI